MNNLPMSWQEFAKLLFKLEDADPIYYALARTKISLNQKRRFVVGWCTYYNPGVAAAASEHLSSKFYEYLILEYANAKRASERRHFRGTAGMDAITSWRERFPEPEGLAQHMVGADYFEVAAHAKEIKSYGSYFSWKWADLQERVFNLPCSFPPECAKFSPKVPQQGAKLIRQDWPVEKVYKLIVDYMGKAGFKAPPSYNRLLNFQEAESICCILKQYRHSKWAPHTRTAKATRSLIATSSDTSELMLKALHQRTGVGRKDMEWWAEEKLNQL